MIPDNFSDVEKIVEKLKEDPVSYFEEHKKFINAYFEQHHAYFRLIFAGEDFKTAARDYLRKRGMLK
jgi:hypothetical protein